MGTKKFNNKVKEVLPNIHLFQNGGVIPYQNSTSNYYGESGLNMTNLFGGMAFDKGFNDMGSIKVLSLREWIKENHKVLNDKSVQEYIKYREDADVQLKDRKKMIPLAMNFAGLLKQNQDDANELENVKNTVNDFPTTTATYAPSGFAQEGGGVNIEDISGNSPAIATMLRGFPRGFSAEHRDMVANTATKELDNLRKKDIIDNTKNYLYDLSVVKTVNNFKDGGEPVIKYKPIQPEALKEVLDINNSNINYIDSPEFNDKIRIALGNKKLKDEEVEKLKRNLKSFYIENASKPITIGELSSKDAAGEAVFDEEGNIEEYRISPDYNNPKDIRDIMYHEFKHTLNKAMESIGGDSKDLIFRNTLPFSKLDNKGIGGLLKQNLDRDGYNYNLLVELPAHLNTVKGFIQDWDGLGFGDITPKRFESFIKDIDKDVESNRFIKKQIEYLNSVIAPDKDNKNSKLNNMLLLMNSITSNDKRDKSVLSAKDGKYINFAQQILGYKDDSPYKDLPSQRIFSKNITMDGVSKSLALISDKGEFKIATPNSGLYKFRDDTKWVDEVPIAQSGGLAVSDGVNRFINKSNNFNTMGNFNDIIRLLNNLGVIKAQDGVHTDFIDSKDLYKLWKNKLISFEDIIKIASNNSEKEAGLNVEKANFEYTPPSGIEERMMQGLIQKYDENNPIKISGNFDIRKDSKTSMGLDTDKLFNFSNKPTQSGIQNIVNSRDFKNDKTWEEIKSDEDGDEILEFNSGTFAEAFKKARGIKGANKFFKFKGKMYITNEANETFEPSDIDIKKAGFDVNKYREGITKMIKSGKLNVISKQDGGDVNFLDSLELADNSDDTYQQVGKLIFGEEYTPLDYDTLIEDIQIKYPNKKDVDTLFSKLVQIGLDVDDIYEDVQDGLEDEDDIEYQDGGGVLPQDGVEGQPQLQEDSTQGFEQTVQVERLIEYATDLAQNLPQNIQQEFVDFIGQSVMEGVPFQTLFPKLQELKFPESYINELGKIYTNAVNSIQGSNDNNVEIQQTPQSDGGQEGTLLSGEGFNQKDGGMIQRFMNGGVVNSKKKVANDDSKEFGFVPLQPLVPIQTEKMETIILPTGDLVKVNATKRHSSMAEDVVTDIVPESSYVLSQFGNTKIYKDEADKVVLEISNAPYNIFSNGKVPKVKTLGDLMSKKVMSPADLSRVVANKFKVVENKDGDVFTAITNLENKKNRGSYLQAIVELSEYDKSRKGIDNSIETQLNKAQMVAKDGGYVKAGVSVPKAVDPLTAAISQGVASLAGIGFNIVDRVNAKKAKNDALKWVDSFNNTGKQTLSLSGLSNALGVIGQNPEIKAVRTDYSNAESAFRNSLASLENQLQATRNSGYINRMDVSGLTAQQRLLLGSKDAASRYDAETKAALGLGSTKNTLLSTYSNLLDKARNDNEANRTNAYNSTTLNQNKMLGTLGGIGGAMFDNFYNHDSNILSTKVGINTGYQSNLSKLNSNLVQTLQNTANAFAQMYPQNGFDSSKRAQEFSDRYEMEKFIEEYKRRFNLK
ncbi:MAG: hypothetical protein KBH21_00490 [Acetoanaerobium sp.]|nr:hypothetical protein [Acetoanaerobium sp.]